MSFDILLPIVIALIGIIGAGIGSMITSISNKKVTEATVAHKISESYDGLVNDLNNQYDRTRERLRELQSAYDEKQIEIRQYKQTVMLQDEKLKVQERKLNSIYARMKQLEEAVQKINGGNLVGDN